MASIITATVSSGLTQSADNSGVLQLASGTGNLVTVPSVTGTAMVSGNMPAFSARAASNQSISNNTWTKVTLDTEIFDTNNCFASSRFTPNVAGYYQVNGQISIYGTTSYFGGAFYKNGASDNQFFFLYETNSVQRSDGVSGSYIVYLNGSTDYIELYGIQASSGTIQFEGGGGVFACKLSGALVRTA